MAILKTDVIYLEKEKKSVAWHGGIDGDYHCDNCDQPMLPSEIAYQNSEDTYDAFCSLACLEAYGGTNG